MPLYYSIDNYNTPGYPHANLLVNLYTAYALLKPY